MESGKRKRDSASRMIECQWGGERKSKSDGERELWIVEKVGERARVKERE